MTQKEAVLRALNELGGKACNQDIIRHAMKYGDFSGSKDPAATIRNYLNTDKDQILPAGKRGWWQLASYQEELANLKKDITEKNKIIAHLRSELQSVNCFSRIAVGYMDANKNKSQNKREEIKSNLLDIASQLHLTLPSDVLQAINSFDDTVLPAEHISYIMQIYNANFLGGLSANQSDINIHNYNENNQTE